MSRVILYAISLLLPWPIRRWILVHSLRYDIHPTSRIGYSWIMPSRLVMEAGARIGHLTVCKGLDLLKMSSYSVIGRNNWITGFPKNGSGYFEHQTDRQPQLILGQHSAITNLHIIDCTSSVTIGAYATFAGFRSQILTHSIDLVECRQDSSPVVIGDYTFVGTACVILGGSVLPSYSVLGAHSLLNRVHSQPWALYGGTPARLIKTLDVDVKYFMRTVGRVA